MYALSEDDPYCILDFDKCVEEDGTVDNRVAKLIDEIGSYTEISPSRTGVHIVIKANIPKNARDKFVELYASKRFMTFTGQAYQGYAQSIRKFPDIYSKLFPTDTEGCEYTNLLNDVADHTGMTDGDNTLLEKMFSNLGC